MSIRVNGFDKDLEHYFDQYCAFIDTEGDFYVIDENSRYASRILNAGCVTYDIEPFHTIEEFLDFEFGDCRVAKAYTNGSEYEIIVNG